MLLMCYCWGFGLKRTKVIRNWFVCNINIIEFDWSVLIGRWIWLISWVWFYWFAESGRFSLIFLLFDK